jgi:hypothetical protein
VSEEIYALDGNVAFDLATTLHGKDSYMAIVENTCLFSNGVATARRDKSYER